MSDDATTDDGTTPEGEGSTETPDQNGSDPAAEIASYRKRQAGADAARAVAEAKAAELEKELAKYRTSAQTDAEKDLSELAATKARLEAAEQRAEQAEAKAEARILDARFPNARKELPEVTDEVRLAKFEAMLAEGDEPPTPRRHNESNTSPQGAPKKESLADMEARIMSTALPDDWT